MNRQLLTDIGHAIGEPDLADTLMEALLKKSAFFFGCGSQFICLWPVAGHDPHLFISLVYSAPKHRVNYAAFMPWLISTAKALGLPCIRFYSTRRGFARVLSRLGWRFRKGYWEFIWA